MPTLRDIKRRIRSVENTRQITRAMKMIAGTRLRRAQERMLAMRPYTRELARVIAGILPELVGDEHTLLERRPQVRTVGLLLVSPDRGLCGGLPGGLAREVAQFVGSSHAVGCDIIAFVSGRKGRRMLTRRGDVEIALSEEGASEQPDVALAERLAGSLADAFEQGRIDAARVIFPEFRSAAAQRVRSVPLLPVARESLIHDAAPSAGAEGQAPWEARPALTGVDEGQPYAGAELEPDVRGLVAAAIRRHLSAVVYRALLEGAASELGARLTAMDAATRNAGDLIADLTLQYNKARQANITKELMDIVGGVEALR
jgi:F-type H+-transporting ATPase subunit gamma